MREVRLLNKPRAPLQPVMRMMHSISPLSIITLSVVLLDLHLLKYWSTGDSGWVVAFGAVPIVLGILLVFSYSYPLEEVEKLLSSWDEDSIMVGASFNAELMQGNSQVRTIIQGQITKINTKYLCILVSIFFTITGTLVAGYAGFLPDNFFPISPPQTL
ncbi:hypothetical protein [Microbulbifer sp. TRSA005]|uniref:hypothetical protein n=1 Tax=Microbulbifer sp. TRSA005 TaxID=3243383 RepID=UPI0040394414